MEDGGKVSHVTLYWLLGGYHEACGGLLTITRTTQDAGNGGDKNLFVRSRQAHTCDENEVGERTLLWYGYLLFQKGAEINSLKGMQVAITMDALWKRTALPLLACRSRSETGNIIS